MGDKQNRSRIVVGGILILLGLFFLFSQFMNMVFHIRISEFTWPFVILVPGVLIYILAFTSEEKTGRTLVVVGSIVTAVGLLLFFQNVTDLWATWAYAWAFIFPTSVGLGQIIYGSLRGQNDLMREGWNLTKVGGIILLVGFTFFELLIGVSGFRFFGLRGFCFPAVLIVGGLLFILYNLRLGRKPAVPTGEASEPPAQQPPSEEA